jgi:hypothetical protein
VFGWTSVAIAALLFALVAVTPVLVVAQARAASPGGGSIGAVAGGVGGWPMLAFLAVFICGVGAAVVGAVRGERPLWVHGLGAVLTFTAPVLAIAVLRAWLG